MRVDPDDRQIVAVAAGRLGERRHAHRAFATERGDPGRVVRADDRLGARELPDDGLLGLDTVAFVQASSDIVTGTATVGPSCGGRTASRTAAPTA
ncbi:hypothetical protein GCM10029978_033520 [Actinoallomurus acanthiterrae]